MSVAPDTTKKGYIILQADVTNPEQYAKYMQVTPGLIEKFGGRFIARGGRTAHFEGPPPKGRTVIVEFPSFDRAQQFYNSSEYSEARKLREDAAAVSMMLVEGQ